MANPDDTAAELLKAIGAKVRATRVEFGMSRRVLSEKSGVSPRYLAQLECGEGNISISLLHKVSNALGKTVEQMVRTNEGSTSLKAHRIALIGLRGAGKSTLGPMLATEFSASFIELNNTIEQAGGMPVSEVFSLYGEDGYRRLERQSLERIRADNDSLVLAVAGGIVADTQTYAYLLSHFHTIWLRAKPEEHMARVRAQGDERPMSGDQNAMAALVQLLEIRKIFYAKADMELWTSNATPDVSLAELVKLLEVNGVLTDK